MNSWCEAPRAAFDLETTGRDPLTARIVTATIMLVDAAGQVLEHHEWLADPGVDIPEEAAAIHGVTTQHARAHGLTAATVVQGISSTLARLFAAGIPVLAFNARYDFTVLAQEGVRHAVWTPEPFPVIDPYIMDKHADRYRKGKRTLTALCEYYGIEFEHAHTSAADVLATLRVGQAVTRRHAFLQRPAVDLHESLVVWAARQAANFEEYLRRTDPEAVIERAWPIVGRMQVERPAESAKTTDLRTTSILRTTGPTTTGPTTNLPPRPAPALPEPVAAVA